MMPVRFLFFAVILSGVAFAQPEAAGLRFEVASVRPNGTPGCKGRWDFSQSPGSLNAENASPKRLISRVYGLTEDRLSGPDWIASECYDIRAKAEGDQPESQMMLMLQALLRERFHLTVHRESTDKPIFALT